MEGVKEVVFAMLETDLLVVNARFCYFSNDSCL